MLLPGLCSITFRSLSAREIVSLVAGNRLAAIEWGGDIHVPAGRLDTADEVRRMCADAGLQTPSYGSYFRVEPDGTGFQPVLESALALGARTIRVWAGRKPSRETDAAYLGGLAECGRRCAEAAARAGCVIGFEYHPGTATDSNESALRLIREIGHPAVRLYWQPRQKTSPADRFSGLRESLPWLAHLHVFQWTGEDDTRLPLAAGAEQWRAWFQCASEAPGDRCAYLEFVENDEVASFARDAATLRELLNLKASPESKG